MGRTLKIFDTTLRDGEQAPRCSMNLQEKVEVAKQLERLGVDVIEAGFPAASPGDLAAVKAVASAVGSCTGRRALQGCRERHRHGLGGDLRGQASEDPHLYRDVADSYGIQAQDVGRQGLRARRFSRHLRKKIPATMSNFRQRTPRGAIPISSAGFSRE